jgi:hypothetical protein
VSLQGESVVAERCGVQVRVTERKLNDDFCSLLPVGDCLQSSLATMPLRASKRIATAFGSKVPPSSNTRPCSSLQVTGRALLERRICTAALAFALSYSGRKRAHSAEFAAPSLPPIGGGAGAEFER